MPVWGWPQAELFQQKAQEPISHPVLALAGWLWGFTAAAAANVVLWMEEESPGSQWGSGQQGAERGWGGGD